MVKCELVYYLVPEDYDYIPRKVKKQLNSSTVWEQINFTIHYNNENWPLITGPTIFDDYKKMTDLFWLLKFNSYHLKITDKIPRYKEAKFKTIALSDKTNLEKEVKKMIPICNNLYLFFIDDAGNIERAVYYTAGEEIEFYIKHCEVQAVEKILDELARRVSCEDYEKCNL